MLKIMHCSLVIQACCRCGFCPSLRMFWSKKRHDTIKVEFFESGKNEPFAVCMTPLGQLPDSFEVATTLDIDDRKWSVQDADPKRKTDFEVTGCLKLTLSEILTMNPQDILFSLPSISNDMCALHAADSHDGMLVIHEDDWRQVEFISNEFIALIEAEMQSITGIYENHRKGAGFTELHLRKLIEHPLIGSGLTRQALKSHFSIATEFQGFGLDRTNAVATHSFAFETTCGLQFFGISDSNGNVQFLCLAHTEGAEEKCAKILEAFPMVCVDWCALQIIRRSNTT